jgi:hypothetical protein
VPGEEHLVPEVLDELFALLAAGVRVCDGTQSLEASLARHGQLIYEALAIAARRMPRASSPDQWELGVHTDDGQITVISGIDPSRATTTSATLADAAA